MQEDNKCDWDEPDWDKWNSAAVTQNHAPKTIITDIDIFLWSQVLFMESNLDIFFGFKSMISNFSQDIWEQMYSLCIREIESINNDDHFANKAYGYWKKSRLYYLIYMIMDNSNHSLHEQWIVFLLQNMNEWYSINFPVQKTYTTVILMTLRNWLKHLQLQDIKLKNKIFAEVFCQLSQKFEWVYKASSAWIDLILKNESWDSVNDLLNSRYGVFWSNVFSSIKYLDINSSTEKILLIFRSLKTFGGNTFMIKLDDVLDYLWNGIDHFLEINDWKSLLVIFEIVIITSELIKEWSLKDPKHSNAIK